MNPSVKVYPSSSLLSSSDRFSNQSKANMPSSSISNSINVSSPVKGALWSQHKLLKTSTLYEGVSEDQALQEYRDYIRRNFHKLECEKFVPEQKQPDDVKKIKDLRCQCWETLGNHEAVWNRAYRAKFPQHKDRIIPPELKALLKRPNDPIPEKMPQVAWDKDTCLVKDSTNAYGKINFNQAVIGGSKPAKYLRMTEKDSMDKLLHVMVHYWRILEPEPPHLVISVVGGAKNFRLDGRNRDIFQNGLIKAAKTTSAWLITSGFNMGVMKAVGGAVRNGQTFAWDKDRMAHRLRCIGIAPWGYVENRTLLCSPDQQGCFPATYSSSSSIKHDQSVSISPDHTHFVFVDNGMRNHYAGVANFRAAFERKISLPTQGAEECGLGTPVVIMVIEGGTDTITAVATSIEQGIPVVVCAGTGRAADVLAYAFSHTLNTRSGERFMPRKHAEGLAKRLFLAYGKNWEGESGQAELERLQSLTLRCCQKEDLMTIFYMQQNEDLDLAILSALVKAKGRASLEQRQNQLRLALTLDRCDIVHQEIFREDILWPKGSLDEIMTEAVLQDRVGFVALLVQQGVVMTEYLTPTRLHQLYNAIPPFCHLRKLLERSSKSEKFSLSDVQKLLDQLLDLFVDPHYNLPTQTSSFDKGGLLEKGFQRPFRELFLWAVLMNRQELAKLCWEMGEDTIATAVIATRLYLSLSKRVPSHEHLLKQQYLTNKVEFEQLATSVLSECHGVDPDKAMMLVEKRSPSWCNMTGLQMAAAANDQVLLSSSPCQNSINLTWKRGLLSSWRKIACALVCPILIWPLIEVESDKEVGVFRKAFLFYKAPITKFAANSVMYLLFLCTYSYMILFDFKETVSVTELICIIWIFTFLVDEIHCLLTFPTPTVVGKFRDWYGFLNRIDLLNLILVFIGFFLKLHPPYLQHAKHIYSLTAVGFYLRIMKLYKANSFLGPKLYMIVRMTEELLLFVSILVVFLLAYGVSSQSLLWPSRAPYWGVFRDIVYYPYWQIYGELFLEEIQSDEECYARYPNSSLASVYQLIPCRTYSFLVPFLLAAYLLIGNVLLLNLLIAIFSHVFDEVQKNTLEIWKYQVYFLVMEYDVRTFLVPPFSILEHVYRLLKYLARHTCCQKSLPKDPFSRKHFQYLQLFEKEMMANYLRSRKADETNSVDFKFNKIQQRVDEITKLIEDEIIADHQHLDWLRESQLIPETMETADSNKDKTHWPTTEDVAAQGTNEKDEDDGKMTLEDVAEETVKERRKEKKRKKKKKHKKNRSMVLEEGDIAYAVPDLNLLKSAAHSKPRPRLRQRFSNLSERNFLPDDLDDFYPRPLRRQFSSDYFAQHYMEDSACSGEEMDLSDMIPIKSVRSNVTDDRT